MLARRSKANKQMPEGPKQGPGEEAENDCTYRFNAGGSLRPPGETARKEETSSEIWTTARHQGPESR
jgi:hypothetical protein